MYCLEVLGRLSALRWQDGGENVTCEALLSFLLRSGPAGVRAVSFELGVVVGFVVGWGLAWVVDEVLRVWRGERAQGK